MGHEPNDSVLFSQYFSICTKRTVQSASIGSNAALTSAVSRSNCFFWVMAVASRTQIRALDEGQIKQWSQD
jgi:hypothetical protein